MANFNISKIIIGGRLTDNPDSVVVGAGERETIITNFSVAVNHGSDATSFMQCKAFGESKANFINNYFKKGDSICVAGELRQRSWTTPEGEKRSTYEIIADTVTFVDSKAESQAPQVDEKPANNTKSKKYTPKK